MTAWLQGYVVRMFLVSLPIKVAERSVEVHGSEDQIEKEKQKKLQKREKAQQKKFDKNVQGGIAV
jgi:hypothetical protein